ncbi:hypothetical protein GCM10009092_24870 [Bowmanella denitrificans]|uniref:Fe2OG dioxygenase domain-containing protein n=1 Tax=Bowmanella denitrificans TaxID=366582 RepID=A0ABP3H3A1_9ALTE
MNINNSIEQNDLIKQMKIELWFPTAIYHHDPELQEIAAIRDELQAVVDKEYTEILSRSDSLERSYIQSRQPEHRQVIQKYQLQQFHDYLVKHAGAFLSKLYPQAQGVEVRESWFNFYAPGDSQEVHNHVHAIHPSFLSGVFYLSAPPGCGDIKFYHPNMQTAVPNPQGSIENYETSYAPIENRLMLFRSHVSHAVMPNRSQATRISVSFNIYVR